MNKQETMNFLMILYPYIPEPEPGDLGERVTKLLEYVAVYFEDLKETLVGLAPVQSIDGDDGKTTLYFNLTPGQRGEIIFINVDDIEQVKERVAADGNQVVLTKKASQLEAVLAVILILSELRIFTGIYKIGEIIYEVLSAPFFTEVVAVKPLLTNTPETNEVLVKTLYELFVKRGLSNNTKSALISRGRQECNFVYNLQTMNVK